MSSISGDVCDMRYVCFFGVFSIYRGCTIGLKSDWSVSFDISNKLARKKWKLLFVSKKVLSKSLLFLEM